MFSSRLTTHPCGASSGQAQLPLVPHAHSCFRHHAARKFRRSVKSEASNRGGLQSPLYHPHGAPGFGPTLDPYAMMDREFQAMEQHAASMHRQMGAEFAAMAEGMRQLERQAEQAVGRALQGEQQHHAGSVAVHHQHHPGVRIQRHEHRSPHSYSYYHSVEVSSFGPASHRCAVTPQQQSAAQASPMLLALGLLAGAYAAASAAFSSNFHLTTYSERRRWPLVLLWPVLWPLSAPFRRQFNAAVRGQRARLREDDPSGGSSSGVWGGAGADSRSDSGDASYS